MTTIVEIKKTTTPHILFFYIDEESKIYDYLIMKMILSKLYLMLQCNRLIRIECKISVTAHLPAVMRRYKSLREA